MPQKKILLGLTTTPGSDWREKIKEIDKFNIKELALFPTFLKNEERKELYNLLEKTGIESIPHVHLRPDDMPVDELNYFVSKFKTAVFNIHSPKEFPVNYDYSKYKNIIYLENTDFVPISDEISSLGNGLCIDFSHWENGIKKNNKKYADFEKLIQKYPIGCCHISGVSKELFPYTYCEPSYDIHTLNDLKELNYIKKYLKYMPDIISIELENSFEEQLKIKEYLEKIINE
ncbi:MAG: hypothetical protein V1804_03865 [Patescibacteria group bacterium]